MNRVTKTTILLLIITLAATACSFKSVYNRMDFLIAEYVEGLITLDDALESDLENRSELLLDWHRTTQLKQYADWFRELQSDANPELDDDRLIYHQQKIETFWKSISARLNTEIAEFLPRLSTEQTNELLASLSEKNDDFRDDYIDIDEQERSEKYTENITETYEDWFGELSDEQIQFAEQAAEKLQSTAERRLELRQRWQSTIQEIITADHSQQQKQQLLLEYFDAFTMDDDPQIKVVNDANKTVLRDLAKNMVHTMSPDQKAYFIAKTDDYIQMFEELAEQR